MTTTLASVVAVVLGVLLAPSASAATQASSRAASNAAILSPYGCGIIATGYQIIPGSDWGTTTGEIQQRWTESQCDLKICAYYVSKYNVVPGRSWGALPTALVPGWSWERPDGKGNCDNLWAAAATGFATPAPLPKITMKNARPASLSSDKTIAGRPAAINGANAPYSAWSCGVVSEAYGLIPGSDWGSTPGDVQARWTESLCDLKVCAYYVSKYGVVPGESLGGLPSSLERAWSWTRPNGQGSCDNLWAAAAIGAVPIPTTF